MQHTQEPSHPVTHERNAHLAREGGAGQPGKLLQLLNVHVAGEEEGDAARDLQRRLEQLHPEIREIRKYLERLCGDELCGAARGRPHLQCRLEELGVMVWRIIRYLEGALYRRALRGVKEGDVGFSTQRVPEELLPGVWKLVKCEKPVWTFSKFGMQLCSPARIRGSKTAATGDCRNGDIRFRGPASFQRIKDRHQASSETLTSCKITHIELATWPVKQLNSTRV
jgi:hypothetical protein